MICDYINGNTLDNRKENLRKASRQQNGMNRKKYINNVTGHTGVHKIGNRYVVVIGYKNKIINLGSFITIKDAIETRENAEKKYFGEFRRIEN